MKNTALRPGYAVQVLPAKYVGPNKATMPESMRKYDAQIKTDSINAALDELEKNGVQRRIPDERYIRDPAGPRLGDPVPARRRPVVPSAHVTGHRKKEDIL